MGDFADWDGLKHVTEDTDRTLRSFVSPLRWEALTTYLGSHRYRRFSSPDRRRPYATGAIDILTGIPNEPTVLRKSLPRWSLTSHKSQPWNTISQNRSETRLAGGEHRLSSSRPSYPRPCVLAHVLTEKWTRTTRYMMEELQNHVYSTIHQ
jgi:hypothetical protein